MYRAVMLFLALTFSPAVVAAQQPCTTDARQVVDELYRHMLERGADAGSAHWAQQLESGRMTVRELVRQIAKSEEHTQRFWRQEAGEETPYFRAVGTLYRHILGRQPDAAGARSWAEQGARSGVSAIVNQIAGSREYDNQFGDWGVPGSGGIRYCAPNNQSRQPEPARTHRPGDQGRFLKWIATATASSAALNGGGTPRRSRTRTGTTITSCRATRSTAVARPDEG